MDELNQFDSCLKLISKLQQLPDVCAVHYDACNFYLAVDEIIATLHSTNAILQETQFWALAKDEASAETLNAILALVFESLRVCTTLLQPIIPNMAERVLNTLNVEDRCWDDAMLHFQPNDRHLNWTNNLLMNRIK